MSRGIAWTVVGIFLVAGIGCGGGSETDTVASNDNPSDSSAGAPAGGGQYGPSGGAPGGGAPSGGAPAGYDGSGPPPDPSSAGAGAGGGGQYGPPGGAPGGGAPAGYDGSGPPPDPSSAGAGAGGGAQGAYGPPGDQAGAGVPGVPGGEGAYGPPGAQAGAGIPGVPGGEGAYGPPGGEGAYGPPGAQAGAGIPGAPGGEFGAPGGQPGYGPPGGAPGIPGGAAGYGRPGAQNRQPQKAGPASQMQAALAAAKEQDALQFAYALAVADPENGKLVLDKYRWYQGLKRPALAMRWGIGVDYNKPRNFSGDPKPIGSHQNLPKKGRRGSRGGGGDFGGGDFGGAPGGGLGIPGGDFGGGQFGGGGGGGGSGFERLTGKLGDKVLEQLKIRLGRGDFGELLKSAPRGRPGGFSGGIAGGGYGGAPGIPGVPGGGGGLPGGEGIPGAGGYGGAGGDGGGAGGGAGGAGGSGGQRLMPGVAYLGEGSKKELFRQAAEQGLDVLLIFDVNVTQNPRSRLTMNNTKVEMYTVADRGRIDATKVLNNIEIQREKDQTKDRDTIKREVENLFKTADQSGLRASDLPASLQPEHIKRRIGTLTGDAHDNPLWVLSEVQFYHYRKFLTDEEVKLAYNAFVGEDTASKLTTGSAAQRLQVMQRWLPKVEAAGRGQAPGQFGR